MAYKILLLLRSIMKKVTVFILTFIFQKDLVKGLTAGAVKG